jgi:hypothetical protein
MTTQTKNHWTPPSREMPVQGRVIDWMDSGGNIVYGGFVRGRLWFLPDGVYVYYTPTFWRYA